MPPSKAFDCASRRKIAWQVGANRQGSYAMQSRTVQCLPPLVWKTQPARVNDTRPVGWDARAVVISLRECNCILDKSRCNTVNRSVIFRISAKISHRSILSGNLFRTVRVFTLSLNKPGSWCIVLSHIKTMATTLQIVAGFWAEVDNQVPIHRVCPPPTIQMAENGPSVVIHDDKHNFTW